jgi:hypothetical protein
VRTGTVRLPASFTSVKHCCAVISLVALAEVAAAQTVPLPRPRPVVQVENASQPSACRSRLTAAVAIAPSVGNIEGPGDCGGTDLVRLETVMLPSNDRIEINPPALLRCEMAEAIVGWLRDALEKSVADTFGSRIRSVRTYTSYHCRGRNNVVGGVTSEHGRGNALDVGSITLANGTTIDPTDVKVSRDFREAWKMNVCGRFSTVLGPGSDGYHEKHIHLDNKYRQGGYRICQWDIHLPDESLPTITSNVPLPQPRPKVGVRLRTRR